MIDLPSVRDALLDDEPAGEQPVDEQCEDAEPMDEQPEDVEPPFLERAAEWAVDLSWRDVPVDTRRAAVAELESTLAAALWSCSHPMGDRIAATVREEFGGGTGDDAVDFLPGGTTSVPGACYGHAALSMALEFDDTVLGGHVGHSAALVPLSVAQDVGASGERALTALVAANEVAARIASAAAVGPFRGQQTAYVHAVAAAVARGVVEDVDPETLADATALALGQPPWPLLPAFLGSDAKLTTAAEPILAGLSAVERARQGFEGERSVVEGEDGFLDEFTDHPLPEFLGGLGERWHTRAITVKPVPGCAYVTAPVEAALDVHRELDGRGRVTVRSITVEASLFCTEADDRAGRYVDGPDSPLAALNFSVPFNVAVALREGEHTPRQFTPGYLTDGSLWVLTDRVDVHHDPSFTMAALRSEVPLGAMLRRVGPAVLPYAARTVGPATTLRNLPTLLRFVRRRPLQENLADADKRMGARVTVELADGETISRQVDHPTGFAGRPLTEIRAVARRKLRRAVEARGASPEAARSAADRVRGLAERDAVAVGELV